MTQLSVIVAAAGYSHRFGRDKRCARLGDGTPMLVATLRPITALRLDVTVVVRPDDAAIAGLLDKYGLGDVRRAIGGAALGDSIAAGVAGAPVPARGYLVQLGDLPHVMPATWQQLAAAISPERIVRPQWRGRPGHPVGFGLRFRAGLLALAGAAGAHPVIAAQRDRLDLIATDDAGVVCDIDTTADLR